MVDDLIFNKNIPLLRIFVLCFILCGTPFNEIIEIYASLFILWQFIDSSKYHSLLLLGRAELFHILPLKVALTFSNVGGNLVI